MGATLQARAKTDNTTYATVTLSSSQSVFGKPLEWLANAGNNPSFPTAGHTLSYSNGQISVTFVDFPIYYPNAGLFVIYTTDKIKQTS
ncbi:hypothetical protein [Chryseobacterium indologenes]|uniref:hypothetical protein n=1 Tax=Chryseobacterium indologenes TaxID=253 RepID=UPI000690D66C|nr:hypothetical protein [Chryseobacterium indologenes]